MSGAVRYFEGRAWRHDPQPDDPDLETDIGPCPDCGGSCVEPFVGYENSVNERPCSTCCDHEGCEDDDDGCCPGCGACPGFTGADCDETCEWATTGGGAP